ncbi:MAG: VWA domain-containing protein [Bacilli bacterium]|nr:VWA domain-containing protein [Bacilli bacterium]
MKEIFKKFTSLILVIATLLNTLISPVRVLALSDEFTDVAKKGDVYDPTTNTIGNTSSIVEGNLNQNGEIINEGDIKVVKNVTKKNDTGLYTVEFIVTGKDNQTQVKLPVYTVFVLDASSSMEGTPWKKAKEAAISFSEGLTANNGKEGYPTNKIALVTFDAGTLINPVFKDTALTESDLGTTGKGTNYNGGLYPAYKFLKEFRETNPDDILNVIFISDGKPNSYNCEAISEYSDFCTGHNGIEMAKRIKSTEDAYKSYGINAKIYTFAYNLTNSDAINNLLALSSNNTVYNTTSNNISSVLTEIMQNEILTPQPAANNAIVIDKLGANFTFVDSNTNTTGVIFNKETGVVSYNIGEIKEGTTYTFKFDIQIDVDSETGWYETNDTTNVKVVNTYNGSNETLETVDTSAEVYWVQQKYGYKVEYYYNGELDPEKTDIYEEVLPKGEKASVTNQDIDDNLKDGYVYSKTEPSTEITISNKESDNVIRVYYVADLEQTKELKYTVEYYKENSNGEYEFVEEEIVTEQVQVLEDDILTVKKENINTVDKYPGYKFINTDPEIIPDTIENNGVIKVYYAFDETQTKDLEYTVEYYKDGVLVESDTEVYKEENVHILEDDTLTLEKDKINTTDKYTGYEFVGTNPEVLPEVVETGSVIKVYYESGLYDYVIKHVEKDNESNILDTDSGSQKYGTSVQVLEKVIPGFTYDSKDKEAIVIDTENNIAYVYYTRNTYSYKVEHYKENLEGLFEIVDEDTTVYENVLFGSVATFEVNEYENYTYDETMTENKESLVPAHDDLVIRLYYTLDESKVIVNYVIKVGDNYIPFAKYGRDEFGNITKDFMGVELESDILTGKIGKEFTTVYRVVPEYTFVGLYNGNIIDNANGELLSGKYITNNFTEEVQEYTYVYEAPQGEGEELPPQTGVEGNNNYLNYLLLISVIYILRKYFKLINTK